MTLTLAALTSALGALLPVTATADSCPNAAERFGASANLPDCRAYELVTPMIKEDNDYLAAIHGFPDGNHVAIMSLLPYPGAHNGQIANTLSTRTSSGWVSTSLTPQQGPGEPVEYQSPDNLGLHSFQVSFASDFSAAFVDSPYASDPLDQDGTTDVYRVDIPSGASSLAALPDSGPMTEALANPPGVFNPSGLLNMIGTFVAGNSADGSHVYFETSVALPTAAGTPAFTPTTGEGLYERYGGHTYLVGVLPDGSLPPCGAEIANGGQNATSPFPRYNIPAIAPDGSNFVFRTPGWRECPGGNTPKLYLREHNGTAQARTVALPGYELNARSADGSKLLLQDRSFYNGDKNIYEYDIPTGQTTIVAQGKEVQVVAFSPDLSHVYYMEGPAQLKFGGSTSGTQLYLYENGTSRPVMGSTAAAGFASYYPQAEFSYNYASTTPDGSKLLFLDRRNLTSYNTEDPTCRAQNLIVGLTDGYCKEAYLYDAVNGSVTCVSCNPNGTPPVASVALFQRVNAHQAEGSIASFIPPEMENISPDGSRVFFETEEALVPQDTNGTYDVYERENGHYYLLSSGHGSYGSYLDGVGNKGNDIFIQSTDNLLPQDLENSQLVYDARVGGGFPYTPPVYGCDSGQCQGPQTPAPIFAPPPSSTFSGLGNPVTEEVKPIPVHKATKRKATKKKHKTPPKHGAKKARSRAKSGNSKRRRRK
jgi:hypothetical protein